MKKTKKTFLKAIVWL